jgi:hypothetical protein
MYGTMNWVYGLYIVMGAELPVILFLGQILFDVKVYCYTHS